MNALPFIIVVVEVPPTIKCPKEVKSNYKIQSSRLQVLPMHLLVPEPDFCLSQEDETLAFSLKFNSTSEQRTCTKERFLGLEGSRIILHYNALGTLF